MPDLLFIVYNKKYLYAKYNAPDGEVRVSIASNVTKELLKSGKVDRVVKQRMDRLRYLVNDFVNKSQLAATPYGKYEIEKLIRDELNMKPNAGSGISLRDMIAQYRKALTNKEVMNEDKPFSKSVHDMFAALDYNLKNLPEIYDKPVGKLTIGDIQAFKKYLLGKKRAQNTIKVYLEYINQFLKITYGLKWHKNPLHEKGDITITAEDIDTAVYLTSDEILKLYNLKFTKSTEARTKVRDVFVFGCLTGLRTSDLKRTRGIVLIGNILPINTKKVGKTVHIPLNPIALEIWSKYNGQFSNLIGRTFPTVLVTICKLAGLDEPVLWTGTRGGIKLQKQFKKYEKVTPHTMRRSFATNAYIAGVPPISIMKITGHKTEASFLKYIRLSNEENADLMVKHPHFN